MVVDVVHAHDRVRVAHRQHGRVDAAVLVHVQRPGLEVADARGHEAGRVERQVGVLEARRVHVDAHAAVVLDVQLELVVDRLHADGVAADQAAVAHVAREAARAVAAVLHLVAGVVEDAVAKVHARRRGALDDQDLVGADAEAAVAQPAHLLGPERQRLARGVEHDEVVAGALHLGEANAGR